MVPEKLDPLKGSKNGTMSATERNDSLEFGGSGLNPPRLHNALSVNMKLNDAYLVVRHTVFSFFRWLFSRTSNFHTRARARAGPPDQVQHFYRLPQHLHGCPESDTVHLRSGLGKPGQTPGGVHLVHQVRIARRGAPLSRAGSGRRRPGRCRRLQTPPPAPDTAGRRTPPVRQAVSQAGDRG